MIPDPFSRSCADFFDTMSGPGRHFAVLGCSVGLLDHLAQQGTQHLVFVEALVLGAGEEDQLGRQIRQPGEALDRGADAGAGDAGDVDMRAAGQGQLRRGIAEGDRNVAAGKEVQQIRRHPRHQLGPAFVGAVGDLGAVGEAEVVKDDLLEALFRQLPGDLLQIGDHGLAARVHPVEAVSHPERAAGGPEAAADVVQGKVGILEAADPGHHGKAVAPEVGDHGVHRGNVDVRGLRPINGGGVVEGAVAALQIDQDRAGRAQLLDRLQHSLRLLEHFQVDVPAGDPFGFPPPGIGVGKFNGHALRRRGGPGLACGQHDVQGGVPPKVQAHPLRGIDHVAAQVDRKEDQRQQQRSQNDQADLQPLAHPHTGPIGYGSQAQSPFCAVKQHQSFMLCRESIRSPAASMAARTSS